MWCVSCCEYVSCVSSVNVNICDRVVTLQIKQMCLMLIKVSRFKMYEAVY